MANSRNWHTRIPCKIVKILPLRYAVQNTWKSQKKFVSCSKNILKSKINTKKQVLVGHLSRKIKILFECCDFTAFHDPSFTEINFVQVGMEKKWRRLFVWSKWVQVWRYSEKGISKLKNDINFMYVGFGIGKIWPVENGKKITIFFKLFFCGRPGYIRDVSVETVWAIPDISGIGPLRVKTIMKFHVHNSKVLYVM